ncbi:MAG: Coproporphyrinogen oxidase [Bacteroidetes bacterium]|jgi:oxygen-independent coproporphyrinogen-3 oxidase|nr:Coproporphyrinogen oxidase [Bacteroidota bacterium]
MGSQFSRNDFSFLKKYDRPGPRYTSYPTAPLFSSAFTAADFSEEIRATNAPGASEDISLYFHFPFCDTLCYFCGCTMLVTRDRFRIETYLSYLKREIALVAPVLAPDRKVVQVHWGGGTPTHLSPAQIRDTGGLIRSAFRLAPDAEMSVEIDPRELTREHLEALRSVGFNRMSMGVQDFNAQVQEAVNRVQPESLTSNVFSWAEELGFTSINVDLIYGLPFQTAHSFEETLRKVIDLSPARIAVFNYAHVPWMKPHQKLIHPEDLPTPEKKLDILQMTIELLCSNGYVYVGMDHFAKPDDELARAQREKTLYRNFQGYSTKSGADLYGFGMSSISHFQNIYAQNTKNLPDYYAALDEGQLATHVGYRMTPDDRIRKFVIMRLMCDLELDTTAVERLYGIRFDEHFARSLEALGQFVNDGLVQISPGTIRILGAGRLLLRNIAMCFDAYLDSMTTGKPVFSRTV